MRMNDKSKTLRLVYPQWQGGDIARWIPEVPDAAEAARGYVLGSMLLDFLAPDNGQEKAVVPVTVDRRERRVVDGVFDRDDIAVQTRAAMDILRVKQPDRIVTLGGECSVSVVPFTYLFNKYEGDVAMVWVDAHPDITLPCDVYSGYHAMAVTACLGMGDAKILAELPAKIEPQRVVYVGLRDWERDEIMARQRQLGIRHFTPADVSADSRVLIDWLKACGVSKVVVHLDLDVLDPAEIIPAAGVSPDGMKMVEVIRVINDIAVEKDIVGLTVAEPMPRTALRIRNMLSQLPLLK